MLAKKAAPGAASSARAQACRSDSSGDPTWANSNWPPALAHWNALLRDVRTSEGRIWQPRCSDGLLANLLTLGRVTGASWTTSVASRIRKRLRVGMLPVPK